MREYVTEALVLRKMPSGSFDARYSLFTKKFGKMVARAKSTRKIISKLAGHLEPGTIARVRIIEPHGLQVVDALKESTSGISFRDAHLLDRLLADEEQELFVWSAVTDGRFSWKPVLAALGWDPAEAVCTMCGDAPAAFKIVSQEFFCAKCAARLPRRDMIFLDSVAAKTMVS